MSGAAKRIFTHLAHDPSAEGEMPKYEQAYEDEIRNCYLGHIRGSKERQLRGEEQVSPSRRMGDVSLFFLVNFG